jgi:serine/threonine protein phosphatase PrpC
MLRTIEKKSIAQSGSMCRIPPDVEQEIRMVRHDPPRSMGSLDLGKGRSLVSYGHAGCAKRTWEPSISEDGDIVQFGQDTTIQSIINAGDDFILILGILDGHGIGGDIISQKAGECAIKYMKDPTHYQDLFGAVRDRSLERIDAFHKELYAKMEALSCNSGGSTCTIALVVSVDGRMVLIVSNVGDSPAGLVKDRVWTHMATDHSPDNLDEYRRYRLWCEAQDIAPGRTVYARINAGGWRIPDADGTYKSIPVFDGDRIHVRNAVHMQTIGPGIRTTTIGGNQSVRKMIFEETKNGMDWVPAGVLPDYYGQNFGSTIEGTSQMTRSLGDSYIKRQWGISAKPDVAVYELAPGEESTLIIGSDGFTDTSYFSNIAAICDDQIATNPEITGQTLASNLFNYALEKNSDKDNLYPVQSVRLADGTIQKTAVWDDVSVIVCRFKH